METNKYYARLTTPKDEVIELEVDREGKLDAYKMKLEGELETNAEFIDCRYNNLTSLEAPNAEKIWCSNNNLTSLEAPNAEEVECDGNKLTSLVLPNAKYVYYKGNPKLKDENVNVPADCKIYG